MSRGATTIGTPKTSIEKQIELIRRTFWFIGRIKNVSVMWVLFSDTADADTAQYNFEFILANLPCLLL